MLPSMYKDTLFELSTKLLSKETIYSLYRTFAVLAPLDPLDHYLDPHDPHDPSHDLTSHDPCSWFSVQTGCRASGHELSGGL